MTPQETDLLLKKSYCVAAIIRDTPVSPVPILEQASGWKMIPRECTAKWGEDAVVEDSDGKTGETEAGAGETGAGAGETGSGALSDDDNVGGGSSSDSDNGDSGSGGGGGGLFSGGGLGSILSSANIGGGTATFLETGRKKLHRTQKGGASSSLSAFNTTGTSTDKSANKNLPKKNLKLLTVGDHNKIQKILKRYGLSSLEQIHGYSLNPESKRSYEIERTERINNIPVRSNRRTNWITRPGGLDGHRHHVSEFAETAVVTTGTSTGSTGSDTTPLEGTDNNAALSRIPTKPPPGISPIEIPIADIHKIRHAAAKVNEEKLRGNHSFFVRCRKNILESTENSYPKSNGFLKKGWPNPGNDDISIKKDSKNKLENSTKNRLHSDSSNIISHDDLKRLNHGNDAAGPVASYHNPDFIPKLRSIATKHAVKHGIDHEVLLKQMGIEHCTHGDTECNTKLAMKEEELRNKLNISDCEDINDLDCRNKEIENIFNKSSNLTIKGLVRSKFKEKEEEYFRVQKKYGCGNPDLMSKDEIVQGICMQAKKDMDLAGNEIENIDNELDLSSEERMEMIAFENDEKNGTFGEFDKFSYGGISDMKENPGMHKFGVGMKSKESNYDIEKKKMAENLVPQMNGSMGIYSYSSFKERKDAKMMAKTTGLGWVLPPVLKGGKEENVVSEENTNNGNNGILIGGVSNSTGESSEGENPFAPEEEEGTGEGEGTGIGVDTGDVVTVHTKEEVNDPPLPGALPNGQGGGDEDLLQGEITTPKPAFGNEFVEIEDPASDLSKLPAACMNDRNYTFEFWLEKPNPIQPEELDSSNMINDSIETRANKSKNLEKNNALQGSDINSNFKLEEKMEKEAKKTFNLGFRKEAWMREERRKRISMGYPENELTPDVRDMPLLYKPIDGTGQYLDSWPVFSTDLRVKEKKATGTATNVSGNTAENPGLAAFSSFQKDFINAFYEAQAKLKSEEMIPNPMDRDSSSGTGEKLDYEDRVLPEGPPTGFISVRDIDHIEINNGDCFKGSYILKCDPSNGYRCKFVLKKRNTDSIENLGGESNTAFVDVENNIVPSGATLAAENLGNNNSNTAFVGEKNAKATGATLAAAIENSKENAEDLCSSIDDKKRCLGERTECRWRKLKDDELTPEEQDIKERKEAIAARIKAEEDAEKERIRMEEEERVRKIEEEERRIEEEKNKTAGSRLLLGRSGWGGMISKIPKTPNPLDVVKNATDKVNDKLGTMKDTVKDKLESAKTGVEGAVTGIGGAVAGAVTGITGATTDADANKKAELLALKLSSVKEPKQERGVCEPLPGCKNYAGSPNACISMKKCTWYNNGDEKKVDKMLLSIAEERQKTKLLESKEKLEEYKKYFQVNEIESNSKDLNTNVSNVKVVKVDKDDKLIRKTDEELTSEDIAVPKTKDEWKLIEEKYREAEKNVDDGAVVTAEIKKKFEENKKYFQLNDIKDNTEVKVDKDGNLPRKTDEKLTSENISIPENEEEWKAIEEKYREAEKNVKAGGPIVTTKMMKKFKENKKYFQLNDNSKVSNAETEVKVDENGNLLRKTDEELQSDDIPLPENEEEWKTIEEKYREAEKNIESDGSNIVTTKMMKEFEENKKYFQLNESKDNIVTEVKVDENGKLLRKTNEELTNDEIPVPENEEEWKEIEAEYRELEKNVDDGSITTTGMKKKRGMMMKKRGIMRKKVGPNGQTIVTEGEALNETASGLPKVESDEDETEADWDEYWDKFYKGEGKVTGKGKGTKAGSGGGATTTASGGGGTTTTASGGGATTTAGSGGGSTPTATSTLEIRNRADNSRLRSLRNKFNSSRSKFLRHDSEWFEPLRKTNSYSPLIKSKRLSHDTNRYSNRFIGKKIYPTSFDPSDGSRSQSTTNTNSNIKLPNNGQVTDKSLNEGITPQGTVVKPKKNYDPNGKCLRKIDCNLLKSEKECTVDTAGTYSECQWIKKESRCMPPCERLSLAQCRLSNKVCNLSPLNPAKNPKLSKLDPSSLPDFECIPKRECTFIDKLHCGKDKFYSSHCKWIDDVHGCQESTPCEGLITIDECQNPNRPKGSECTWFPEEKQCGKTCYTYERNDGLEGECGRNRDKKCYWAVMNGLNMGTKSLSQMEEEASEAAEAKDEFGSTSGLGLNSYFNGFKSSSGEFNLKNHSDKIMHSKIGDAMIADFKNDMNAAADSVLEEMNEDRVVEKERAKKVHDYIQMKIEEEKEKKAAIASTGGTESSTGNTSASSAFDPTERKDLIKKRKIEEMKKNLDKKKEELKKEGGGDAEEKMSLADLEYSVRALAMNEQARCRPVPKCEDLNVNGTEADGVICRSIEKCYWDESEVEKGAVIGGGTGTSGGTGAGTGTETGMGTETGGGTGTGTGDTGTGTGTETGTDTATETGTGTGTETGTGTATGTGATKKLVGTCKTRPEWKTINNRKIARRKEIIRGVTEKMKQRRSELGLNGNMAYPPGRRIDLNLAVADSVKSLDYPRMVEPRCEIFFRNGSWQIGRSPEHEVIYRAKIVGLGTEKDIADDESEATLKRELKKRGVYQMMKVRRR